MSKKATWIITLVFFLLVNTAYLWDRNLGFFSLIAFMGVMLYFLLILAILLRQLFLSFNENFADKSRLLLLLFMGFALTSCLFFPTGILNFEKFESQNLLVASREAGANCKISLKLKENNTFSEKTVCFGTSETSGKYSFRNDTIFFEEVSLGRDEGYIYEFAVIRNK